MNFQGKAVLVYLEEDNIARAYFRVQPLMTQDGPLGAMEKDYPDDGFLRIVPDKNEQHTFKDRMRMLSGLCLVDLRFFPLDANKIRTNKNYSPTRGETNQFIVYSDAVRELPERLVYQVVSEGDIKSAATPYVYIRNGANIQGPFRREDGQSAGDATQLPPDSSELHEVTVNGQALLFYWPKEAESAPRVQPEKAEAPAPVQEPVPAKEETSAAKPAEEAKAEAPAFEPEKNAYEQIQSLNEQLSESANRLKPASPVTPLDFAPEQPARPLTGTKLYQAPQRQQSPRRAHNSLMEAVENQRYNSRMDVSRYEAPGATIPQNTELKEVHNPADVFKRALQGMCHSPEDQRQAVDVLLAQPGMRPMLAKALGREANDLAVTAMHSQLQELEAERLMTLMQLDDAKKNLAQAHEQALGKLNMAEQKKLDQLHIAQQTAQNALDKLNKVIGPLEEKRQAAAEQLRQMENSLEGRAHFVCPPVGGTAAKEELIERVEKSLKAAGFLVEEGDALSLLTAFALADDNHSMEFRSVTCDDAWLGLNAFAAALGTKVIEFEPDWEAVVVPGGNAPVFVNSGRTYMPLITNTSLDVLGASEENDGGWIVPYPQIPLYPDPSVIPEALPDFAPVNKECILKAMLTETELSTETKAVILNVRKALSDLGHPISMRYLRMISRFVAAVQNELKGGVAEAIDRAFCLYVAAHILDSGVDVEAIKPHLSAMPRTLKALKA